MKTLKYILGVILGLIALIFIEGLFSLGQAFQFEQYNWLGYTFQGLIISATIIISILITHEELNKE